MPATLSVFTPSLAPHEDLEQSLVVREKLLDNIMWRIRAAATSPTRSHTLLVGPRGSGKTHLIALAYHRTRALVDAGEIAVQTAWLPEDPWAITSYERLLTEIVRRLEPPANEEHTDRIEAEALLTRAYRERGPIVVFTENLDKTLVQIGDLGQQRLRHMAQEGILLMVSSATQLTAEFEAPIHPFFWFFTTDKLKPFTVEQAAEMLIRIAELRGDEETAEYLRSDPKALARLRTVQHLAGGQPRVWALLANAMTVEGLDDLVDLLLTKFDDLTPYYQEQLAQLSLRQREVVVALVEADRALSVKDLASTIGVDPRSLSKTMTELRERGWVTELDTVLTRMTDRRLTYYELAEPLARLAFQIKESRGTPVRLIVDFLKSWFDPADLTDPMPTEPGAAYVDAVLAAHAGDPVLAVTRRLLALQPTRLPTLEVLGAVYDALDDLTHGMPAAALALPGALRAAVEEKLDGDIDRAADLRYRIHVEASTEFGWGVDRRAETWVERAERLAAETGDVRAVGWLAYWQSFAGFFDRAILTIDEIGRRLGSDSPETLRSRNNLGLAYGFAGRIDDAIAEHQAVLTSRRRFLGDNHPATLATRNNLALAYESGGRIEEAITEFETVLDDVRSVFGDDHRKTLATRNNLALSYRSAGRIEEAINECESVLGDRRRVLGEDHPDTLASRHNLAQAFRSAGQLEEAITEFEAVLGDMRLVLGADHPLSQLVHDNLNAAQKAAEARHANSG